MSELSIEERVNLLLKEGIDNPKKWMSIHGYKEPDETKMDFGMWHDEWKLLREHHLEETKVLFDIIGELTKRVK